ncbi:MAG: hypothetical protein JWM09_258 [Francisellaceae bacterium]|nr:hypothetical protein [Francisellaceae bacterium]
MNKYENTTLLKTITIAADKENMTEINLKSPLVLRYGQSEIYIDKDNISIKSTSVRIVGETLHLTDEIK